MILKALFIFFKLEIMSVGLNPLVSIIIFPGFTAYTQYFVPPFPFPSLIWFGFLVTILFAAN